MQLMQLIDGCANIVTAIVVEKPETLVAPGQPRSAPTQFSIMDQPLLLIIVRRSGVTYDVHVPHSGPRSD